MKFKVVRQCAYVYRVQRLYETRTTFGSSGCICICVFFFHVFWDKFYYYGYCLCTVHEQQPQSLTCQTIFSQSVHTVHYSRTHKFYFSTIFSLKISPTVLFTYLKIILLQCFSIFSCIQTDPHSLHYSFDTYTMFWVSLKIRDKREKKGRVCRYQRQFGIFN